MAKRTAKTQPTETGDREIPYWDFIISAFITTFAFRTIITLSILTVIFTILGGTLAYWRWQTSDSQKTNVVFTLESDFSCAADGGGNISQGDVILIPTEVNEQNSNNYIKRTVTVTPTINVADKTIYMDLWLDINTLGTGLSNSDNFMYSFTTTDTSPYDDVVVSGNFRGKKAGDKIRLFTENFIYGYG